MYASAVPISSPKSVSVEDVRRSVTYHPSVWGDHFLAYTSHVTEISVAEKKQVETQKDMVRNLLAQSPDDSVQKTRLIDAIQRLGVAYHFREEIDKSLSYMYENKTYSAYNSQDDNHLYVVATRFRLLRQQGYYVPCDVFSEFVNEEGDFKESLVDNIGGMLSLYEAAHLGVDGELILDKAIAFCSSHLESYLIHAKSNSLSKQVSEALKNPIRKSVIRSGARKFISTYQEDESHNEIILKFAKLDFNIVQKIHQKELSDLTRWWKGLDFANKLPFARDRMVECYFWILAVFFEPRHEVVRRLLTKVISLTSIADDIYDIHGTLDELQLFTQFIQRWDVNGLEQLPEYMRIYSVALLNVYLEIEDETRKTGASYGVHYAKEEMKKLLRAYLEEAKWCYSKYVPTMEEYMKVALVSSAYGMLSTTGLVGLGNRATPEDFDWITSNPQIIRASMTICRLMDDIVGCGTEGKVTGVECYMKEKGCSKMEAFDEFENRVKKAWKDINQECLTGAAASLPILEIVINFTRLIHVLYSGDDGYTNSKAETKKIIESVLVHPLTI